MTRQFKYYPEDFGDLTVKVRHMDLDFDVYEEHTVVNSKLHVKVLDHAIRSLDLNAKNLEVLEVTSTPLECSYEYLKDEDILRVKFEDEVEEGTELVISTKTICRPTNNILEGLYYDETPKGCPCQQITQCQQWGFQRIVPCIDDMTAKCTYKTTIKADERYTHLLSNGDVSCEVSAVGEGRVEICYDNMITPMATYLFFLGVGTYSMFEKEFIYPNGDKFMLQLLVPPGSDKEIAEKALSVLHDAILWVYLFTGPNKYENWDRALMIKEEMEKPERDYAKLASLLKGHTWGYKYTGTVYREIGMQNSDFGGMENVGNTTITTNRIMPFPEMTDGSFEYMIQVKVHEYYHNLNGSEVTGRSPFEIWLNEAVTVFIEQEYHAFLFGDDYNRLDRVLTFLAPGNGTFAGDDRLNAMPIEPDGFNDCNELITGVTYVKAPELVRMFQVLMGKEVFVKGLDLYHNRYKHSNASRAQWVEAMEEESGLNLQRMAETWLKQSSYPKIDVVVERSAGKTVLSCKQRGFKDGMHWEFPFVAAVFDENGQKIGERMARVLEEEWKMEFDFEGEIGFVSLNREYSCFGKVFYEASEEELYLQVKHDDDIAARYMAFYYLAEREKMKVLEGGEVSERFVDLYFALLSDEKLMKSVGSSMLAMFEQVEDERFAHDYQKLYETVKAMKMAVVKKYEGELLKLYKKYSVMSFDGEYVEVAAQEIKARSVKNACLALLSKLDKEEVWAVIREQFEEAGCATDKVIAFKLYMDSGAPDKGEVFDAYYQEAVKSLVSWEAFVGSCAGNDGEDFLEMIKKVEDSEHFRIEQANDQRALYCRFAMNRKKSLQTASGREFLKERILKLAPINEYSCGFMVNAFGNLDKMKESDREALIGVLKEIERGLDQKATPSVYNNVARILASVE